MRLEAVDLAIGYPGRVVGKGMSLALDTGEVLGLLGPNDAGKTRIFPQPKLPNQKRESRISCRRTTMVRSGTAT
jgi:ABC-type lipopolysaccharide export system ATPase subunit